MPSIEKTALGHYAVLWRAAGSNRKGETTVAAPVEIKSKWSYGRGETIDDQGSPIAIDATVKVAVDIAPGSYLWRGKLKDLPGSPTDLYEVLFFRSTSDIKCRNEERILTLARYTGSIRLAQ